MVFISGFPSLSTVKVATLHTINLVSQCVYLFTPPGKMIRFTGLSLGLFLRVMTPFLFAVFLLLFVRTPIQLLFQGTVFIFMRALSSRKR